MKTLLSRHLQNTVFALLLGLFALGQVGYTLVLPQHETAPSAPVIRLEQACEGDTCG